MNKILLIFCVMITTFAYGQRVVVDDNDQFDIHKYLGKWYEIARMDHHFERGMICVTANYSLRSDGKIKVENSGFSVPKDRWSSSEAVAKTTHVPNKLKVYFFPLISGRYNVAYVDSDYSVAVVSGGSRRYLWFLSRTPEITLEQKDKMLSIARDLGYDTSELLYVSQTITTEKRD